MSNRSFLFISLNGKMSFWEYSEGTLLSRSIFGEKQFPNNDYFWELLKTQYRFEEEDSNDFLYLSNSKLSRVDIPNWFNECHAVSTIWTCRKLSETIPKIEDFSFKTVILEFKGKRSTICYGNNPTSPIVLYGIATSEFNLTVDIEDENDNAKLRMNDLLSTFKQTQIHNEQRCERKR